jgi:hypothetical protein
MKHVDRCSKVMVKVYVFFFVISNGSRAISVDTLIFASSILLCMFADYVTLPTNASSLSTLF